MKQVTMQQLFFQEMSLNQEHLKRGKRVKNIAHMFGGVKGKREISSMPIKRKPEGDVGGGISSLLGISENQLSSKLVIEGICESPAKRRMGDLQLPGSVAKQIS